MKAITLHVANRIIELLPGGLIDRRESFDEYILDPEVLRLREEAGVSSVF